MKWVNALSGNPVLTTAIFIVCSFFLVLWGPPLFDLDEGAFTAATTEMLLRGDFITTWLNGEPRFDKPILIYWFQALSVSIAGRDEFFFRFPSALAASLWVIAIYRFAAPRFGPVQAQAAVVFFCSCLTVIVIGKAATADALLNLLITLTLFDAWRFIETNRRLNLYLAYLWIGLGILTKGPVAAAVPIATLSLFALIRKDWSAWLNVVYAPLGWLITILIAAPWYVLEYQAQGQAFIDGFLLQHNLARFGSTMESHGGSVFYYLPVLLLMTLPFSAWLVSGGWFSLRDIHRDPLVCWCWCWFAFVFLFFSLSGTQLPHYILYGSTPLFLLMARHFTSVTSAWWAAIPSVALLVLWLCLPIAASQFSAITDDAYLRQMLERSGEVFTSYYWIIVWLGILLTLTLPWLKLTMLATIQSIGLTHILVVALAVIPATAEIKQGPVKRAAEVAAELNEPVVMWRADLPSFTTYRRQVTPKRHPQNGELVFTRAGRMNSDELNIVFSQGGVVLARFQSP